MAFINKVTMVGSITKDPEVRKTSAGTAICFFGIESSRPYRNRQNGSIEKETCFIDVNIWGAQAEAYKQSLKQGQSVLVEGHIKFSSWQDKSGNKQARHLIVADQVIPFYSSPDQVMNAGTAQSSSGAASMPVSNSVVENNKSSQDYDDLPF